MYEQVAQSRLSFEASDARHLLTTPYKDATNGVMQPCPQDTYVCLNTKRLLALHVRADHMPSERGNQHELHSLYALQSLNAMPHSR
jgi:hypothetical protein